MENIVFVVLMPILGLIMLALFLLRRTRKNKLTSEFSFDQLSGFPGQCKLYFDVKTGSKCLRCQSVGTDSEVQVRKRYLLFRDEQNVLKHKRLAFLYSCPGCNYKSLDKIQ